MEQRSIRLAALLEAARDVCAYCGGRALQRNQKAEGPNEAGNWVHGGPTVMHGAVLCEASAIYARIRGEGLGLASSEGEGNAE